MKAPLLAATMVLTVALAGPAWAQRGGGGGGGGFSGGGFGGQSRLMTLETAFTLTKDQSKKVKALLDDAHKSAAPVRLALAKTRAVIADAVHAKQAQAEVDAAVKAYAEQAALMVEIEMKALSKVLQSLEKEQRANAAGVQTAFFLMRGMFLEKNWNDIPTAKGY